MSFGRGVMIMAALLAAALPTAARAQRASGSPSAARPAPDLEPPTVLPTIRGVRAPRDSARRREAVVNSFMMITAAGGVTSSGMQQADAEERAPSVQTVTLVSGTPVVIVQRGEREREARDRGHWWRMRHAGAVVGSPPSLAPAPRLAPNPIRAPAPNVPRVPMGSLRVDHSAPPVGSRAH